MDDNIVRFGLTPDLSEVNRVRNELAKLCPEQRMVLMRLSDSQIISINTQANREFEGLADQLADCDSEYRKDFTALVNKHGTWKSACVVANHVSEMAAILPDGYLTEHGEAQRVFQSSFVSLWQEELASIIKSQAGDESSE